MEQSSIPGPEDRCLACDTVTSGTNADGKEVECFGLLAQHKGAKAIQG